ncbi:MAG: type II toxin-antitoxin system VapC family toxin [Proteobacteria bacterium]|nr:type II toxin-antitoxin system VapC family toxin [Pseudomonadota bacterium]
MLYEKIKLFPIEVVEKIERAIVEKAIYFKTNYRISVADSIALGLAKVNFDIPYCIRKDIQSGQETWRSTWFQRESIPLIHSFYCSITVDGFFTPDLVTYLENISVTQCISGFAKIWIPTT